MLIDVLVYGFLSVIGSDVMMKYSNFHLIVLHFISFLLLLFIVNISIFKRKYQSISKHSEKNIIL